MSNFKSIDIVNTSNGWAVRQVNEDGTVLFILPDIFEPRFSQEHAQTAAEDLKRHLDGGGETYAKALPPGVSMVG